MSCLLALLAAGCLEAPPDTEPAPLCGTTRVLADEFEAESEEWYRYGSTELAAGRVLLYAAPGSSSGMSSTWEYQLAGSELTMQIRRVDVADDGELAMALVNREDDAAGLLLAGGNLSLFQAVGESYIAPYSVPFAPDALWWRLGEAGGELSWSTSTDGSTWIDQGSLPLELVDPVVAEIDLRAASTQVVVEIEAIAPSADEDLCAAWSLTDEFDADSRRWYASSQLPGCAVSVDQGALVIEQDNVDRCGIESAEHFDLTGSSFAVEVVDAGDCDLAPYLTVLLSGLYPEIGCVQSEGAPVLVVQMFGDGEAPDLLASIPYDSDLHRFWRIRHDGDGGQLVFETRRDSGEWDDLVSTPIDDELVRGAGVALEAADDSPDGTGEPVVFDHFNLVP